MRNRTTFITLWGNKGEYHIHVTGTASKQIEGIVEELNRRGLDLFAEMKSGDPEENAKLMWRCPCGTLLWIIGSLGATLVRSTDTNKTIERDGKDVEMGSRDDFILVNPSYLGMNTLTTMRPLIIEAALSDLRQMIQTWEK